MRVVIQKVIKAKVTVDEKIVGNIDAGLVVFVAFKEGDTVRDIEFIANKIVNMRLFEQEKSLLETDGKLLVVSQFTLYADATKGRRPSYSLALKSDLAYPLYEQFVKTLKNQVHVETGIFGADMLVDISNDGPATIILDSKS